MSIFGLKSGLLFIIFMNSYPMISVGEIQFSELFCPTKPIYQLAYQRQGILILNNEIIYALIIYTKTKTFIWLKIKKISALIGDLEDQIKLLARLVLMYVFKVFNSTSFRL